MRLTLVVTPSIVYSIVFTGWMLDAQSRTGTAVRQPDAVLDLMTQEDVAQLQGQWRYSDVEIVEVSSARITLSETVTPGEQVQVAIFAINGPISAMPENRVCMREAKVEFVLN